MRGTRVRRLVLLVLAVAAAAAPAPCRAAEPAPRVAEVLGFGTLALDDGTRLRLAGLAIPEDGAPGAEARRTLSELVLGREVARPGDRSPIDRHGRLAVQLLRADGLWVQGEMLRRGQARVRTQPGETDQARDMLAAEAEARAARRGLWRDPAFRVRDAEGWIDPLDGFHLVEGTVLAADRVRDRIYLNFGEDWRTDFTAVLDTRDLRAFRSAGLDPIALAGRRVRLRGHVFLQAGPAIALTHPEQVEILP